MFPVVQKVEPVVEKGDRSQDMAALGVILLMLVVCCCRSNGSFSTVAGVVVSTCIGRLLGVLW